VNFASIPISYLTFSIKDITTGVNDTVSFSFYVNNILANKFKMYGGMTFLSDVLGRGSANDEQSELREAPLFRFFENGTAKLICDCSLYQIPVSAFSPMNAYDANIIHCLKAMSDHINDLSAHQVYSTFNHQKNHNYPTHNGCILLCNGVQVNL